MKGPLHLIVAIASAPLWLQVAPAQLSTSEIAKRALPSVVLIKTATPAGETSGAGFVVDASGTVVTNLHVIQDATAVAVKLANGDVYDQVRVKAFDQRKDIAVIQVPAYGLPVTPLGDSDSVEVGDQVVLIGNPLGLEGSVSAGVVSGNRALEAGFQVIQTDAAANPGNSGGPLLDAAGRAVGVLSFKLRGAENLNFVIPINYVRGLLAVPDSMDLLQFRQRLGTTTDLFAGKEVLPTRSRWKSLASGTTKIVRLEGDRMYVETLLPDDVTRAGGFTVAELTKKGDAFVGVVRSRIPCLYTATDWGNLRDKQVLNHCTFESPIEIRIVSTTRIEGMTEQYPQGTKFNCKKCSYSQRPVKSTFTWIPE